MFYITHLWFPWSWRGIILGRFYIEHATRTSPLYAKSRVRFHEQYLTRFLRLSWFRLGTFDAFLITSMQDANVYNIQKLLTENENDLPKIYTRPLCHFQHVYNARKHQTLKILFIVIPILLLDSHYANQI